MNNNNNNNNNNNTITSHLHLHLHYTTHFYHTDRSPKPPYDRSLKSDSDFFRLEILRAQKLKGRAHARE